VRTLAFNTLLIAGVSTLLFNGNPLLRFDGYYILMDWLEMPNLAARANRYLGYLVRHYLFGLRAAESTERSRAERVWCVLFAIGSFAYRMFVLTVIIILVASQYFVVGVLLALWAAYSSLLAPLGRVLHALLFDAALAPRRLRAVLCSAACLAAVAGLLGYLPVPYRTAAEGIVWIPEDARVRAGAQGFVTEVLAAPGQQVAAGQPLLMSSDPALTLRVRMHEAELEELQARYDAAFTVDRVLAMTVYEELALGRERLADARAREAELLIESPADGIFMLPGAAEDLPGRYLQRGELVGYVVGAQAPTVRVLVPQRQIDIVRQRTSAVELRFAEAFERTLQARVWNESPGATTELPSAALGLRGGGTIATDPAAGTQLQTFQRFFQFDLLVEDAGPPARLGGRAYVRFMHGSEPLVFRWYRSARQLLLEVFNV
jgi:putative peptide zinc metalloprotease protein